MFLLVVSLLGLATALLVKPRGGALRTDTPPHSPLADGRGTICLVFCHQDLLPTEFSQPNKNHLMQDSVKMSVLLVFTGQKKPFFDLFL
jgi:hypothetical protein